ncbi:hypothetical protein ABW20_dc0106341 [Dactylellina cionopaga]|nr:hypothetical protein ABW20_dc0106341 [Dactylellina cionopaga]
MYLFRGFARHPMSVLLLLCLASIILSAPLQTKITRSTNILPEISSDVAAKGSSTQPSLVFGGTSEDTDANESRPPESTISHLPTLDTVEVQSTSVSFESADWEVANGIHAEATGEAIPSPDENGIYATTDPDEGATLTTNYHEEIPGGEIENHEVILGDESKLKVVGDLFEVEYGAANHQDLSGDDTMADYPNQLYDENTNRDGSTTVLDYNHNYKSNSYDRYERGTFEDVKGPINDIYRHENKKDDIPRAATAYNKQSQRQQGVGKSEISL